MRGKNWHQDGVEDSVRLRLRDDSMQRLDESWSEHIGGFEGEFEDVVFGLAFDAGHMLRPRSVPVSFRIRRRR